MEHTTIKSTDPVVRELSDVPVPGVILIFSAGKVSCLGIPLKDGAVKLGRGDKDPEIVRVEDPQMSRLHARVAFDGATWSVEDLGSTNGTWVDREAVRGEIRRSSIRVIRAGASVFLPVPNIRPYQFPGVTVEQGMVLGVALQEAHAEIRRAAGEAGGCLLVTGESGTGKELAARAFHRAGPQSRGPFVAVNCAAIPEGLAERLLFGARRGAYSGATHDTEGYVQAAHGGTLFLDEIAELDAAVQAKLLRTIDTRQVLELGAVAPRPVQIRVCAATHDLRARVAEKKFREDLYYRIGSPEVRLPPLRERLEEIPWLLDECCAQADEKARLSLDVSLVMECLLRDWPGNLREFVGEARRAALRAVDEGRRTVEAKDLHERAGMGVISRASQASSAHAAEQVGSAPDDEIAGALRLEGGNVSRAATRLGVHRNKVRRWLEKNGLKGSMFGPGGDLTGEK